MVGEGIAYPYPAASLQGVFALKSKYEIDYNLLK